MNETSAWSPDFLVRQTHAILHLNAALKPVSHTFNITYDSMLNEYSMSLVPIPAILMALGLLAVVGLMFTHFIRFCGKICCRKDDDTRGVFSETTQRIFVGIFVVVVILTLFADQILLFGNAELNKGVDDSQNAVDYVHDLSVTLTDQGNALLSYGYRILLDLQTSSSQTMCVVPPQYYSYINDFVTYVNDFLAVIAPVPGQCDDINRGIDKFGVTYKNQSIWVLYAVLIMCLGVYVLGVFCKSRCTVMVGLGVSELLMIVFFIAVGVELVILMGFSDFCMAPVPNALGLLPRDVYNVTSYYATCSGVNPLQTSLDEAEAYVTDLENALNALLLAPQCANNPYVTDALSAVQDIQNTMSSATAEIACAPTNAQIESLLHTGLCERTFTGVFLIWVGQYLTTALLLCASILATILLGQFVHSQWLTAEQVVTANENEIVLSENLNASSRRSQRERDSKRERDSRLVDQVDYEDAVEVDIEYEKNA